MKSLLSGIFISLLCVSLGHSDLYTCPNGKGGFYYSDIPCSNSSVAIKSDNVSKPQTENSKSVKLSESTSPTNDTDQPYDPSHDRDYFYAEDGYGKYVRVGFMDAHSGLSNAGITRTARTSLFACKRTLKNPLSFVPVELYIGPSSAILKMRGINSYGAEGELDCYGILEGDGEFIHRITSDK